VGVYTIPVGTYLPTTVLRKNYIVPSCFTQHGPRPAVRPFRRGWGQRKRKMLSKLRTLGLRGIDGFNIMVEVDVAKGLPTYAVVGLPDTGIKESKDRVVAAVRNSGFDFPVKKITVNLAPAEIKKTGTHFDLPIALGSWPLQVK